MEDDNAALLHGRVGDLWRFAKLRQVKSLNKLVEQAHRRIKRLVRPGLGFKGFDTARRTMAGYEVMAMVHKGQVAAIPANDMPARAAFITSLLGGLPDGGEVEAHRARPQTLQRNPCSSGFPPCPFTTEFCHGFCDMRSDPPGPSRRCCKRLPFRRPAAYLGQPGNRWAGSHKALRPYRSGGICSPSELKRVSNALSPELKNITATVKWFKADKGYGFVRFIDGSGEAFIHASAIAPLGDVVLTEGMTIVCDVAEGQRGPQVGVVHRVEPAAPKDAVPTERKRSARQRVRSPIPDNAPRADTHTPVSRRKVPSHKPEQAAPMAPRELMLGTVRWYNLESQSGIIDPDDDVFPEGVLFDRATLRQSGLDIVADGEDVWFTAYGTPDGAVADHVQLAPGA